MRPRLGLSFAISLVVVSGAVAAAWWGRRGKQPEAQAEARLAEHQLPIEIPTPPRPDRLQHFGIRVYRDTVHLHVGNSHPPMAPEVRIAAALSRDGVIVAESELEPSEDATGSRRQLDGVWRWRDKSQIAADAAVLASKEFRSLPSAAELDYPENSSLFGDWMVLLGATTASSPRRTELGQNATGLPDVDGDELLVIHVYSPFEARPAEFPLSRSDFERLQRSGFTLVGGIRGLRSRSPPA
ncbi:MAG: hypothetical protein U0572_11225 [Phycisphaerales bacterium]